MNKLLLLLCVLYRCPTSEDLGLVLYSVNRLTWGFRFHVPKFDGRDELYLVCDALVCDRSDAEHHHCDRSCVQRPVAMTTRAPVRRRHVVRHTLPSDEARANDDDMGLLSI